MSGTKGWDELWVGVKCQTNPEIAGSPRNVFRYSLEGVLRRQGTGWVRGRELTKLNQTTNASGCSSGVRQWGISFIVERETAQTAG